MPDTLIDPDSPPQLYPEPTVRHITDRPCACPSCSGVTMPEPNLPGVAFVPPPVDLQPQLSRAIADAVAHLPKERNGALVGLMNEQGVNAAVVARMGGCWEVQAWVGKTWKAGAVQYGGSVRASW